MRRMWDDTKTRAKAAVKARLFLMFRTLSVLWFVGFGFLGFTLFNIILCLTLPGAEMFWNFPILTAAIAWMCWREFSQLRGRYGGRGFFGVLRNAAAHKEEVERVKVRKTMSATQKTRQGDQASRAATRDRLTRTALTLIGAQSAEPRARKIAQKALKSGDHERMLGLIADNHQDEPRSADAARNTLGAIARV